MRSGSFVRCCVLCVLSVCFACARLVIHITHNRREINRPKAARMHARCTVHQAWHTWNTERARRGRVRGEGGHTDTQRNNADDTTRGGADDKEQCDHPMVTLTDGHGTLRAKTETNHARHERADTAQHVFPEGTC